MTSQKTNKDQSVIKKVLKYLIQPDKRSILWLLIEYGLLIWIIAILINVIIQHGYCPVPEIIQQDPLENFMNAIGNITINTTP